MNSRTIFKFRLYVAGNSLNAIIAIANLNKLCREHLEGRHLIEVVDVFKSPQRALADQVYMTPLLLRIAPAPVLRIVGNLDHTQRLLVALGLGNDAGPIAA